MNLNNCLMSYKLPEPRFFQSLSIIYKCTNCMLFKWKRDQMDILVVAVKNGRPMVSFEGKHITMAEQKNESTVRIEKIGTLLNIEGDEGEPSIERVDKYYIINPGDSIQVGGKEDSSDGYIFKVLLNEQNFGIWKFTDTDGLCKGEKRETSTKSVTLNFFNGQGYKVYSYDRTLNPKQLALGFYISTFDENSLIYLAKDDSQTSCSYIALYLNEGFIYFHVVHADGVSSLLKSDIKYNDGRRYQVEVAMKYEGSYQSYELSIKYEIGSKRNTNKSNRIRLPRKSVFKIKAASRYIGGVPPTFNRKCIKAKLGSFLGILETAAQTQLINETISFGVIHKKNLEFYHGWVKEGGRLQLKLPEEKLNSLYFIVRPVKADGLIIKFNDDQKIAIEDYKLKITGLPSFASIGLNENDYNIIHLTFDKLKTLTVNDRKEDITRLDQISIRDFIEIGDVNDGFVGGIRHIIVNDELVSFNPDTVIDFFGVDIGREESPPMRESGTKSPAPPNFTNSMQNTEGCSNFGSYDIDTEALKYGDKPQSFTRLKTNFWRRDYNLSVEFRTFDPDEMILISVGQRSDQYVLLELKKGKPVVHLKRKKKKVNKPFDKRVNDGSWHRVVLEKIKKKLTITIDKESKFVKLAKHNLKDEIYFAGVPDDFDYSKIDVPNPFRGCLRNLAVNDEEQLLMKNNNDVVHSNIRQCFSNVEEGAYFSGDSYGVYKDDYHVSKVFELSFEFRTAEQNGILASISKARNSPAISVEMQNGAIVMAVDAGEAVVTNVTNNLDSDFALCNNRWHNVTAMYTTWELTINVDGIRKSWVQQDVGTGMDELEAPLYIAGLPDGAPVGTLKTRENFKGCIRNLRINNEPIEWTDMKLLNNVMLSSCPTEKSENYIEPKNFYTVVS